jgi:SecD/SecF fusion protein
MKGKSFVKVIAILFIAVILGILDLPPETKAPLVGLTPDEIKNQHVHLGLDLQGGAQLDYKIDLRKVPLEDQKSIIDGVKEVINKRVNALGVSEPRIVVSEAAGESHIIVDLAGVDVDEAKATIGKTIQLEFKERKDQIDPNEKQKIEKQANDILQRIQGGEDYTIVAQEEELSNPATVTYSVVDEWKFKDEVSEALAERLFNMSAGTVYSGTVESRGEYTVGPDGQLIELTGINVIKLTETQDAERTITEEKKVNVSHVLIAYEGAERADESVTRTKEEALALAEEVASRARDGEEFKVLSDEVNDDASAKDLGGVLISPAGEGQYVPEFESAALAMEEKGEISDPVESSFGYHVIESGTIVGGTTETKTEKQIKYETIFFSTIPNQWQDTGLTGEHFVHADVQFDQQLFEPYVSIAFNDEGSNLFAEITDRNIGKPLAIFVGGELISAPTVRTKITGGNAIIEGNFSIDEATTLARDLNTGAIPAPIVLSGQYTIGAELGQDALVKSLWAGVIGLILIAVYMTLYYRLFGLVSVAALGIYAVILLFLIQSQLNTIVAMIIAVTMFVILMMRILNSKDNGWEKLVTSVLAVFALFFIVFLLANPIVLTLAGVAGVILSIGMAVDANILIFERIKEEIRDGRPLGSAIDIGFDRAWSSIRDSNFSSLITCGILFYFGSSIIQGFAFNLAAGILVSMFTAITITKTFLHLLVGTRFAKSSFLLGAKPTDKKRKTLNIIGNTKKWFIFSGILVSIAIVSIFAFGLKLGIDFSGGTLMQVKFEQEVDQKDLSTALEEIGGEIYGTSSSNGDETIVAATETEPTEGAEIIPAIDSVVDFSTASIIWSSDGYIIKTKYISTEVHDQLLEKLEERFGALEEPRFTTVGPTVGDTMKNKAIQALGVALLLIVLYIAFAFRKIPKKVSPWRFGLSAIVALAHDVIIVVGIYAILGNVLNVEIDALFITALLTILGFSVHDTIVVFDRVRENLKDMGREVTFADVANAALTQTMARSMNTSISTLFTLVALLVLGSTSIFWFVLALVLGTIVGTYSSIFVASPVLVWWNNRAIARKER